MSKVTYSDLENGGDANLGIFAAAIMFGRGLVRDGFSTAFILTGAEGVSLAFEGEGFTYDGAGQPRSGRATACSIIIDGEKIAKVADIDVSAKQLRQLNSSDEFLKLLGTITASGSTGVDYVVGHNGDDTLRGREGSDLLGGGRGDDKLFGGADDDQMFFGQGRDSLDGGDGIDIAIFTSTSSGVEKVVDLNLDLRKGGFQAIEGGASVKLYTMEGISGSYGDDRLTGDANANVLGGADGADTISGGAGDDTIGGGRGSDVLKGGEGFDTLVMSSNGQNGVNVTLAKTDVQNTGEGKDRISGFENLIGSSYDDRLSGDANSNRIEGGSGNDTISGGGGRDGLLGDTGIDRFVFNAKSLGSTNLSEILDFDVALEVMDLSAIDASTAVDGNQAFSFIGTAAFTGVAGQLRWSYFGNDPSRDILVQGDIDGDGAADLFIQLRAPIAALAADDFVL